jgi:hypothetical protein
MFLFWPSAKAERRKRSHPSRAFGAVSRRAKIPSPRPPSFLPFCFSGFARFEVFFSPVLFFVPTKLARRFHLFNQTPVIEEISHFISTSKENFIFSNFYQKRKASFFVYFINCAFFYFSFYFA